MLADTGCPGRLHGDRAAQHLSRVSLPYKTGGPDTCQLWPAGASPKPDVGPFVCKPVSTALRLLGRTSNHPCPTPHPPVPSLAPRACPVPADSGFPNQRRPSGPRGPPPRLRQGLQTGTYPQGTSTWILRGTYKPPGPASVRAESQPDRLFAKGIKRIVSLPFWDSRSIRCFFFSSPVPASKQTSKLINQT